MYELACAYGCFGTELTLRRKRYGIPNFRSYGKFLGADLAGGTHGKSQVLDPLHALAAVSDASHSGPRLPRGDPYLVVRALKFREDGCRSFRGADLG